MEIKKEKIHSGDVFTLETFIENCECGGFTDYGGFGYYSDGIYEYEDFVVYPSAIVEGIINRDFSHVVWFNR